MRELEQRADALRKEAYRRLLRDQDTEALVRAAEGLELADELLNKAWQILEQAHGSGFGTSAWAEDALTWLDRVEQLGIGEGGDG